PLERIVQAAAAAPMLQLPEMRCQGSAQPPLPGSFPAALTLLRQQAYLYQPAPLAVPAAYSTWGASSDHLRELLLRDHYLPERRELHPVYRHEYSQMRMASCDSSLFGCPTFPWQSKSHTRVGDRGKAVGSIARASATALAIAAPALIVFPSPSPFAPSGVRGEGVSWCAISTGGISPTVGHR